MYACSVIHVTNICCFEFPFLEFVWLPQKFATLNFAILNFRERSWIFPLKPYETSFENSTTFHGKFAKTKDEFRLHYCCTILYIRVKYVLQFSRHDDLQNTGFDPAIWNCSIVSTSIFEAGEARWKEAFITITVFTLLHVLHCKS